VSGCAQRVFGGRIEVSFGGYQRRFIVDMKTATPKAVGSIIIRGLTHILSMANRASPITPTNRS
jgi:hypothetical protein